MTSGAQPSDSYAAWVQHAAAPPRISPITYATELEQGRSPQNPAYARLGAQLGRARYEYHTSFRGPVLGRTNMGSEFMGCISRRVILHAVVARDGRDPAE